jgi:hypothetical protein
VILEITHTDQLDVLHEALESFLNNCDPKQWRAVAAAESLIKSLTEISQKSKPE